MEEQGYGLVYSEYMLFFFLIVMTRVIRFYWVSINLMDEIASLKIASLESLHNECILLLRIILVDGLS